MTKTKGTIPPDKLELILEALKEKKAKEIITINLEKIGTAICDHFVICHGDSTTQVDALSGSVSRKLKSELNTGAHHIEGNENSLWVLMDYSDIVVHIFLNETRSFYNLEELWADGEMKRIEDAK
ncbi:MAG: ribosome silencing factor [Bacteroidales bacterium]